MRVNQYCEEVSKGISHLVFPLSRLIRSRERHIRGNIDFSQQKKRNYGKIQTIMKKPINYFDQSRIFAVICVHFIVCNGVLIKQGFPNTVKRYVNVK